MFVKNNRKRKGINVQTQPEYVDRTFNFLTRERAVGIVPEANFRYNTFSGANGDDEWARSLAMDTEPDPLFTGTVTFGSASIPVFIKHLKKYDIPDASILDIAIPAVGAVQARLIQTEGGGEREHFDHVKVAGFPEPCLPAHPGILRRAQGSRTKEDAEISALCDALGAVHKIQSGLPVAKIPCAIFGRGKRVWGVEAAGRVGAVRAGRMVLCPDSRDDLLIRPVFNRLEARHKSKWETSEIMLGMSWQNRGVEVFTHNIIADLHPTLARRISPWTQPSRQDVATMGIVRSAFQDTLEPELGWFVLDISRQDASISTALAASFFRFASGAWYTERGRRSRRLGRYLAWIEDWHAKTRIALPDGEIWQKHHGNVSGSPLTAWINSYTALLAVRSVFRLLCGTDADLFVFRVYGDNLLVGLPKLVWAGLPLEDVVSCWRDTFGQGLNPDESYKAETLFHYHDSTPRSSASFLSKHFLWCGGVWRPASETLGAMVAPQTSGLTDGDRYTRAVGLMLDNPFNGEATEFLTRVLDCLENRGTMSGSLDRQAAREIRYRSLAERLGVDLLSRLTIEQAQDLYLYTDFERGQLGLRRPHEGSALDRYLGRFFGLSGPVGV